MHIDNGMHIENGMHSDNSVHADDGMYIDCDTCVVRGRGCGDCVVTVLLGAAPEGVLISDDEQSALAVLADSGLIPPLRMQPGTDRRRSGS
jgi:hypothetical protein